MSNAISILIDNLIALNRAIETVGKLMVLKPGHRWIVRIEQESKKRSKDQNRRMWAVLQEIAEQICIDGRLHRAEVWHEFYKARFLRSETAWICGQLVSVPESTTTLSMKDFAEYMTQIEAHATQELGARFMATADYLDEWRRYL